MTKRAPARPTPPPRPVWVRGLLFLCLLPMAAGAVLLLAALFNVSFWRSPNDEAVVGGVLLLGGFAAANVLQRLWRLAAVWGLGAAALLLGTAGASLGAWARPAAWLLAGAAVVLVTVEFVRRMPDPGTPSRRR